MPTRERLVRIFVGEDPVDVPAGSTLLKGLEHYGGRSIAEGNYCWTGECGHCEVVYAIPGRRKRIAMACCVTSTAGLRVTSLSRYLELDLSR
jgi:hypothetical protein